MIDLFRKSHLESVDRLLFVEGFLDKFYINHAIRYSSGRPFTYRVMTSGESLELRDENNYERAGVWLLALQVLLAHGWADSNTKIRAIADADADGLKTLDALSYLISRVKSSGKPSAEDKIDIKVSNTNFGEKGWENNFPLNPTVGAIWIQTEVEDLWPSTYLDRFFSTAPPEYSESRAVSQLIEFDGELQWDLVDVSDRNRLLPDNLHPRCLTRKAKARDQGQEGTFFKFLIESPPSQVEADQFLTRLERVLQFRHAPSRS